MRDLHNFGKRLTRFMDKLKNDQIKDPDDPEKTKPVLPANKQKIIEFCDYCSAQNLTAGRILKYMYGMVKISHLLNKPFRRATKQDIVNLINTMENNGSTDWQIHDIKVCLKKFYNWIYDMDPKQYPKQVTWITTHKKRNKERIPEELLKDEEIVAMAKKGNIMEKALVLTLAESGFRSSELLNIQLKHIEFLKTGGVKVGVTGKTGFRRIKLITSEPELKEWFENHPDKSNSEAYLWISWCSKNQHKPLSYAALNMMLRRLAKKSGVEKRVNPHAFRAFAASKLASYFTNEQLKKYFGWHSDKVISSYVAMSDDSLDRAIDELHGIVSEGKVNLGLEKCPRCRKKVSKTDKFCRGCSFVLDVETGNRIEEADRELEMKLADPKVREQLAEILLS